MAKTVPKGFDQNLPDLSYKTAFYIAFSHQAGQKEWLSPRDVINFLSAMVKMPDDASWKNQIDSLLKSQAAKSDGNLLAGENNNYKIKDQVVMRKDLDKYKYVILEWLKPPNEIGHPTPPSATPPSVLTAVEQAVETKPVINDLRNGLNEEENTAVDPNLWMSLYTPNRRDPMGMVFDSWNDPQKPRTSNYILFGMALHLNDNKWMTFEEIVSAIRVHFPYYEKLPADQVEFWKRYCKQNWARKIRAVPDYFESQENGTVIKYKTGPGFAADMKKWKDKNPNKDTRLWMNDPSQFDRIVHEVIATISPDQVNISATSTTDTSLLSNGDGDADEDEDEGNETKPALPYAYLTGIVVLLYGYDEYMAVEEIISRLEELFPFYRNQTILEKNQFRRRLSSSLAHLSKNQTARGRFVDKKENERKCSFKINRRLFLEDFEPWLRKYRSRKWDKWTDVPGEFFKILDDVFERNLKLFDTPAIISPQRPTSRMQAITSVKPKVPVELIMGMATINSAEKKLFSRDLKRAIVDVLPYYGRHDDHALGNIIKKTLFGKEKRFGQIQTSAPDSRRTIGKFYIKNEEEMKAMAEQYLNDHPDMQAVEHGLRNGDELHKMVSGDWKPYESNLDPNLKLSRPKEEALGRTPTTRRSTAAVLPSATAIVVQGANIGVSPPASATRPATVTNTDPGSDSELEVEDEEVQQNLGDIRHPFGMSTDWRVLITGETPTFEAIFPLLVKNKTFPISTSMEEYHRLKPLYEKHEALVREMNDRRIPDWENDFERRADDRRRDEEDRDRRRSYRDNSRGRSRRHSRERSYSRERSRDRYRRDSYRRRSRNRDDSRERRRYRSRSRDDYRRRSRRYDSYSPRRRHSDVPHCAPDTIVSGGQLYQKVGTHPPPMYAYPPYPYGYMPPPLPYMAPPFLPQAIQPGAQIAHGQMHPQMAHGQMHPQMMYHQQQPHIQPAPSEPPSTRPQSVVQHQATHYRSIKREIEIVEINDDETDLQPARHPAITAPNQESMRYYDERTMDVDHEETLPNEGSINAPISF